MGVVDLGTGSLESGFSSCVWDAGCGCRKLFMFILGAAEADRSEFVAPIMGRTSGKEFGRFDLFFDVRLVAFVEILSVGKFKD